MGNNLDVRGGLTVSASARISGGLSVDNGSITATNFAGNGAGLTNLNAGTVTSIMTGAGLRGGPITGSGTIDIPAGAVTDAMLANPSVTLSTSSPLSGGGAVALGGMLNLALTGIVPLAQLPAAVVTNNAANINLSGAFTGDGSGLTNLAANAIAGGLTTNFSVLVPGGRTNTLCFTNGVLRAIQ